MSVYLLYVSLTPVCQFNTCIAVTVCQFNSCMSVSLTTVCQFTSCLTLSHVSCVYTDSWPVCAACCTVTYRHNTANSAIMAPLPYMACMFVTRTRWYRALPSASYSGGSHLITYLMTYIVSLLFNLSCLQSKMCQPLYRVLSAWWWDLQCYL